MSPEFSICIPVLNNKYIQRSLDSIFTNKFHDYEVVVNDSSRDFYVSDFISEYDVKIIKKKTKSFESRMVTVLASSGSRILILDDTRLVTNNLLEKLNKMPEDMIVIGEKDIGNGFLVRLSNLDKKALSRNEIKLNPIENKSVIPRLYNSEIIVKALKRIQTFLSTEMIKNIVGLDLEIIYYEAFRISQSIGILSSPEIMHYGDETFRSMFEKYYKYGFTQRMLKTTVYSELANITGRNRSGYPLADRILTLPLQAIRGVPFTLGYISGGDQLAENKMLD